MKTELKQIIDELSEVIKDKGLQILDKDVLDFALKLYITESINKQKQFYPTPLKNEQSPREFLEDTHGLATQNQLSFLRKQGKTIPEGLTKKEAYLLIKNIKGK